MQKQKKQCWVPAWNRTQLDNKAMVGCLVKAEAESGFMSRRLAAEATEAATTTTPPVTPAEKGAMFD